MKKKLALASLIGLFCIITLAPVGYAQEKQRYSVAKDEVISDDLFVAADSVQIDGKVEGDVYAAASTVIVTGFITGDLITAGETITVSGTVGDDIIAAGKTIDLDGARVTGSARVFALTVLADDKTAIDETLVFGAQTMNIVGTVGRNVVGAAADASVDARIGRDVLVGASNFSVSDTSVISGNVTYSAAENARIEEGAEITGAVKELAPAPTPKEQTTERNAFAGMNVGFRMWSYFAALLVGVVCIRFGREFVKSAADTINKKMFASLGWGMIMLIFAPIALLFLMFTLIGIPLALFLLLLYIFELYASKIIVGAWLGEKINTKLKQKSDNPYMKYALGLLVLYVVNMLPVVSLFTSLFSLLAGLGAIVLAKKEMFAAKK